MCGFAGILRISDRPLPQPSVVRRMLASLAHRGPDESGEFLGEDVHLAITRLSIVDPAQGRQPVSTEKGSVTCVFNGEIYNHAELRTGLEEQGHHLATRCDAEVLPHLYQEQGEDFVHGLHGMFAAALWDQRVRRLVLVRDRIGIKPLFWTQTRDFLLFASELKAILASGLTEASIDRDSLDDLFSLSYPCPPRTMFRGIFELRPAHVVTIPAGRPMPSPRRYWRAPFVPRGEHRDLRRVDAERKLADALHRKVATHLQADVPVATYLSGGLDSSAIATLMAEVQGAPPATFSIGFTSPEHDERPFARQMVDELEARNWTVVCDAQTADHYPEMIWHTELPLQYPLALPLMRLSGAAREHGFPVVLTGEGADELLGGYDCFRVDRIRRLLDRPGLRRLRGSLYRRLYGWLGSPGGLAEHLLRAQSQPAHEVERAFGGVYPPWHDVWAALDVERGPLLARDGRRVRPIGEAPEEFSALVRDDIHRLDPLDAGLALELETRLPAWILLIGDRASMANAVEARVPFLDHEIVELLAPLAPSLKLRSLTEKSVLRGAMRGRLPESIRRRRKRPFYTPIKQWFFAEGRPAYVDELLSPRAVRDAGLFDESTVSRLRSRLEIVPEHHLLRMQLEWILVLVLGTQLLQHSFVDRFDPGGRGCL